jgi:hypothetical protein
MQAQTRITWLKVGADILIIFGLLTALASITAMAAPTSFLADLIFWPVDGGQFLSSETDRLFAAITGGLCTGLGILFYLLADRLYPVDPKLTRLLMSVGLGGWFVVDSLGSLAAGAPLNVMFNLGFLALFMLPLWLPGSESELPKAGKRLEV